MESAGDRLDAVEIHLTHLERTVEELNDLVYEQQKIIDALQREMKVMQEQLRLTMPSLNRLPEEEEPPPHY